VVFRVRRLSIAVAGALIVILMAGCGPAGLILVEDEAWAEMAEFGPEAYTAIAETLEGRLSRVRVPVDVGLDEVQALTGGAERVVLSPLLFARYGPALDPERFVGIAPDRESLEAAWEAAGAAASVWVSGESDRSLLVLHEGPGEVIEYLSAGLGSTPEIVRINAGSRRSSDVRSALRDNLRGGSLLVVATSSGIALEVALTEEQPLLIAPLATFTGYPPERVFGEIRRELSPHAVLVYEYSGR
jgi:hypothetical protein